MRLIKKLPARNIGYRRPHSRSVSLLATILTCLIREVPGTCHRYFMILLIIVKCVLYIYKIMRQIINK